MAFTQFNGHLCIYCDVLRLSELLLKKLLTYLITYLLTYDDYDHDHDDDDNEINDNNDNNNNNNAPVTIKKLKIVRYMVP